MRQERLGSRTQVEESALDKGEWGAHLPWLHEKRERTDACRDKQGKAVGSWKPLPPLS